MSTRSCGGKNFRLVIGTAAAPSATGSCARPASCPGSAWARFTSAFPRPTEGKAGERSSEYHQITLRIEKITQSSFRLKMSEKLRSVPYSASDAILASTPSFVADSHPAPSGSHSSGADSTAGPCKSCGPGSEPRSCWCSCPAWPLDAALNCFCAGLGSLSSCYCSPFAGAVSSFTSQSDPKIRLLGSFRFASEVRCEITCASARTRSCSFHQVSRLVGAY